MGLHSEGVRAGISFSERVGTWLYMAFPLIGTLERYGWDNVSPLPRLLFPLASCLRDC